MIQRALMGALEPQEDRALQKIGRKKQAQNVALLIELPYLNAALIEAYRNLDHTWAAKEMARRIKTTQQQAKWATELWHAAEQKLASYKQQQQQQSPLSLPAPTNDVTVML